MTEVLCLPGFLLLFHLSRYAFSLTLSAFLVTQWKNSRAKQIKTDNSFSLSLLSSSSQLSVISFSEACVITKVCHKHELEPSSYDSSFGGWGRVLCHAACMTLVPLGIQSMPPATEAWSLNHWSICGSLMTLN